MNVNAFDDHHSTSCAVAQRSVRRALRDRLRRSNGTIAREDLIACLRTGYEKDGERIQRRLLRVREDRLLEWKQEVDSEGALRRRVGGASCVNLEDLVRLWARSRELGNRSAYPYLVPSGNTSQRVKRDSFGPQPVYGIDLLLRPPNEFSQDRAGAVRNELRLGEECIALVVHGIFEGGRLASGSEYFSRIVVGNGLRNFEIVTTLIPRYAWSCEQLIRKPLLDGDMSLVVDRALPYLHKFAVDATASFYA